MSPIVAIHKVSAAAGNLKRRFESAMSAVEQTENPTAVPRLTKLRESCDSCLVAKVKCSKSRPVCTRCLANGANCGYSPSSRAGRKTRNAAAAEPSKSSTRYEKAAALALAEAAEAPPPSPTSFLRLVPMLDNPDRPHGQSHHGGLHDSRPNLSHEDPSQRPSETESKDSTTAGKIEMHDDSIFNPPFGDDFGDNFLQFSPPAFLHDFNPTTPSPTNSISQDSGHPIWTAHDLPNSLSTSFQLPVDFTSLGQMSASHAAPSPELRALQEIAPETLLPPGGESKASCDCFALCLQALQTLHNHTRRPASAQPGGLPFDVVLTINREAMHGCAAMLDCARCLSKSGSSISTMLLATIFGKIISLYGAACFFRFGPSTSGQQAVVKLAFGAYTLTGEDRRLLEMEIILLELRKVESILLAYHERFRDAQAEKDETSVYHALTSYLDKNLRYILDFLQARRGTCP
ncbi:hypothetical protein MMC07_002279 [Pseudocyphellaria aurata]|nr:hypothetical protein [Pseudocyphellaria aurata]